MTLLQELNFALDICKQAGELALELLRSGISSSLKEDGTPVTEADKQCERLIRDAISRQFPGDTIIGEEEGQGDLAGQSSSKRNARRKWIIDPIDGTFNYARSIPFFSTLLALESDGEIVLGVVHAPMMKDTFWAAQGQGAYKNGERIFVSAVDKLSESLFDFGGPNRVLSKGLWPGFTKLMQATYRQRGFGDYLGFAFVFEGKAEAMLETGVMPWDLAPMKVIVEEAGGRFSDLTGGKSIYTGDALVTNGHVHDEILEILLSL